MNKVLFYHLEFPAGGTEKVTINIAKFLIKTMRFML